VISFADSGPGPSPGSLAIGINLVGLALLTFGTASQIHEGLGGSPALAAILLVAAVAAWLGWTLSRVRPVRGAGPVCLAVMALAGGALAVAAPLALVFVGVASLGASIAWSLDRAFGLVAAGPLATLVTALAAGHKLGVVLWVVAAALTGIIVGVSRRQAQERTAQAAMMEISEARAEAERARAELLAGRNHLARELHDVLAHTLSALSLQLEALDALISADHPAPAEVRSQLDRTKRLVRDGLDEARGAVQALREDSPPLEDQLTKLAGDRHADIRICGLPRRLSPEVSLTLYRVAQEALTNAVKHAPGAPVDVTLGFDDERVTLSVANGPGRTNGSNLADSGSGYGLQGIRERVLLIGGHVEAGPAHGGWLVQAEVPA
jgi:signal transduction histidine kinase